MRHDSIRPSSRIPLVIRSIAVLTQGGTRSSLVLVLVLETLAMLVRLHGRARWRVYCIAFRLDELVHLSTRTKTGGGNRQRASAWQTEAAS